MYRATGRPSIPPEHLLKGLLLMALFSVRSERQFCEQLGYNLLYKWFLDLNIDDTPFDHSTFSRNRERLLEHDVARAFFAEVRGEAERQQLLSREHFSVDGTMLHRKGRGQAAELAYLGHILMENRSGLVVDVDLTSATGTGERDAAVRLLSQRPDRRRITVGADKGYDTRGFVAEARAAGDAARRTAHHRAPQRHRRPYHAASWLRSQSVAAATGGAVLRLGQDRRGDAQTPLRRPGRQPHVARSHGRRLPPCAAHETRHSSRRVGTVRPRTGLRAGSSDSSG
jgi:IS5 family transposase